MAKLRADIPFVMVYAGDFQDFDHGKEVEVEIDKKWGIVAGDRFYWGCVQFDGTVSNQSLPKTLFSC